MRALLLALLIALPLHAPVHAQESPEAVYAKFHKAGLAANFPEMRKWGTAAKGAEIAAMPAAMQQSMLTFLAAILPKTYTVDRRTVDDVQATLDVSSKLENGPVYGVITLLKEDGEWKVEEAKWGEPPPPGKP
jgi:hypothetical protein